MSTSGGGMAQSTMGTFYGLGERKVCIDPGFYDRLKNGFKAPGDGVPVMRLFFP